METAGGEGLRNLLEGAEARPFGAFHVFTIRTRFGKNGTEFFLDGRKGGSRDRLESMIGVDRMVIGGRYYSNNPGIAPGAQGSFAGEIALVAAYGRALSDEERVTTETFLQKRLPALEAAAGGQTGHGLEMVQDPPPVQVLVPGFSVQEVPLKLGNINSLRYRHDGKLIAVGYDGKLSLLSDTDNDGVPDKAEVWWDQAPLKGALGLALLPANDPRGEGAFVPSKTKLSLLLDRNRDGVAEEEIIAADGWKEIPQGVDTVGVAVHPKDGSLYFCIGCANYADAYLHDAAGNSNYRIDSLRGTVQHLSADFKTRETVATGVRFLCALAFNKEGDLFATEQEGATWLPNGNPYDELLHIVSGRHYGFPPRHPRHLPNVLDEPSTFDFAPQHQSTCGMVFNQGVNGGPAFGPSHWHDDALVCGESRGKIWRTKLVSTPEGYVAQTQLIACLNLLTVDACVTPRGDYLIACHTGPPDWGTGPAGEGRLFLVKWVNHDLPQPVLAWAAAPDEFRIAFDKPLRAEDWKGAKEQVKIEAGQYVSAGDRFETVRPGYQVVRDQMASPRRWIDVQSLALTADARTLVLKIPRQTQPVNYAVTLPLPDSWKTPSAIAQAPQMDVLVNLNGVQTREGPVLPHPSPAVSKALTAGSADHEAFFATNPAAITLQSRVNTANLFQPATQPGATLDWDISKDAFANRRMALRKAGAEKDLPLTSNEDGLADLTLTLDSQSRLVYALDQNIRTIALNRVFTPWMQPKTEPPSEGPVVRTDVKGNWLHGRQLYFGKAICWTCHPMRGDGLSFGPELTNLLYRDRAAVIADILKPSATINPDHAGSTLALQDGTTVNGIIGTINAERVVLRLPAGARQEIPRSQITSILPMKPSLMPEGLWMTLNETEQEDLLTFLLTTPLEPAPITRTDPGPPPSRKLSEVMSHLSSPDPAAPAPRPLRILLSAGPKDHGLNEHDYPVWLDRWSKLLALADNVTTTTCMGFPTKEQLAAADVTIFYSANGGWDLQAAIRLDEYQQRGGGLVYLHWGIEGHAHPAELAERIGLATSASAFRHGEMDLRFSSTEHPITAGFKEPIKFVDETYWRLKGDPTRIAVLANATEEAELRPQMWTRETAKSRVFSSVPGHYTWTLDDPLYRILVLRGICWSAHEPDVNRLAPLTLVGARFTGE